MKLGVIDSKFVLTNLRLDGKFHLSEGLEVRRLVKKSPYGYSSIGDVTSDIYCPGIFRRNYTNSGTPFLGGGDIQKNNYDCGKYLRASTTPNYEILQIKKGWTLVTCGGTIGDTVFANNLLAKCWLSQHVMRVVPSNIKEGMLYAYLASKYGHLLLTTNTYGSVIPTLNASNIQSLPIPKFQEDFQKQVDGLIQEAAQLREKAAMDLDEAQNILKKEANLLELTVDDYDFYGSSVKGRIVSTFTRPLKSMSSLTINAFNYSKRIQKLESKINCQTVPLAEVLENGQFFTTGSFPRIEVEEGKGIMLINQSDIFDAMIKGKFISRKGVKTTNMVEYGEVLIAGVGTLGESETFCRTIFANEELQGQLVSGEFLRMKTNELIPSGYLYTWLSSDYGFRIIRSTQAGTKLCRPIQKLLLQKPVPIINKAKMEEIDNIVRNAHSLRHQACENERKAISMVEQEIEKWS